MPGNVCQYKNCGNRQHEMPNIKMFRFPSNSEERLNQWIVNSEMWDEKVGNTGCLKDIVSNLKTLKYFELNTPIVIECDASNEGLGAALYQKEQVVAYASRTLTKTEKRYAQIEKEMLAVVFACTRFDQYVSASNRIIVKTDHKPLVNIFKKPLLQAPKRLQLMLMILQKYNLEVNYIEGKKNYVADALSRAPESIVPSDKAQDDLEELDKEKKIFKIIAKVSSLKQVSTLK